MTGNAPERTLAGRATAPETDDDGAASAAATAPPALLAVVLSGGRARRLGGRRKAYVRVHADGPALLDGVLDAVAHAGVRRTVVVGDGPLAPRDGVRVTREEPPFSGPLMGLAAGVAALADEPEEADVLVLACDLPRAGALVALLTSEVQSGRDGAVVVDAAGRTQWLAGRYRIGALRRAVRGAAPDGALRAALGSLDLAQLADTSGASVDVDTPEDLHRARGVPGLSGALGPCGAMDLTREDAP